MKGGLTLAIINAQNFPRDPRIRKLVIPNREDEVLLEGDLSQAESMIVAWYAQERTLMEKYRNREDVHSFTGSIIMERPITKADKLERTFAKRIVHGSNYNMQPPKIVEILLKEMCIAMEVSKARRMQMIYFQNFPRIRTGYHMGIQQELRDNNRIIRTPVGFARKFYSPMGDELFREAYAFYPQNIVAFITNQAILKLYGMGFGKMVVAQIHDSILMSVPQNQLTTIASSLNTAMTYPIAIKGQELVIPVDLKAGKNWGEMEDLKRD